MQLTSNTGFAVTDSNTGSGLACQRNVGLSRKLSETITFFASDANGIEITHSFSFESFKQWKIIVNIHSTLFNYLEIRSDPTFIQSIWNDIKKQKKTETD